MSASRGAIGYLHLPPDSAPPDLSVGLFKAVMILEAHHSEEWRDEISRWLVRSGCRYMMAWGRDCEAWDHSVDTANLMAFNWNEVPEEDYVPTTWHADQPLSEAFWYAGHCAMHPVHELEVLLVDVGPVSREAPMRAAYLAAQADPPD